MRKKILFGMFVFSVVIVFLAGAAAAKDKIVIGQAIALSGPMAGGVSIAGGTLYSTTFPCILCAKILINAHIKEIYIGEGYPDDLSKEMLEEAGVAIHRLVVDNSEEHIRDIIK